MPDTSPAPDTVALSEILRPRSVGDILDATIRLYRRHFLLYFGIVMVVQGILFVITQFFTVPYTLMVQRIGPAAQQGGLDSPEELMAMLPMAILTFLGFIMFMVAATVGYLFSTGGLVVGVSETFLGRRITIGDTYREVLARFWSLFGSALLTMLLALAVMMVGLILFIVPIVVGQAVGEGAPTIIGVLVALGTLLITVVVLIYVSLSLIFTPQAVMLENAGAVGALQRSWQLMRVRTARGMFQNNFFRVGILLLIVGILTAIVSLIIQLPIFILMIVVMVADPEGTIGAGTMMPLWLQVPQQLLQAVATALVTPVGSIAIILFYYDIRIRHEGYDLQVLAGEIAQR